jgi:hypothetical protein
MSNNKTSTGFTVDEVKGVYLVPYYDKNNIYCASEKLILHANGKMEQFFYTIKGKRYHNVGSWKFTKKIYVDEQIELDDYILYFNIIEYTISKPPFNKTFFNTVIFKNKGKIVILISSDRNIGYVKQ